LALKLGGETDPRGLGTPALSCSSESESPTLKTDAFLIERDSYLCGDQRRMDRTVWKTFIPKEGRNQRSKGQVSARRLVEAPSPISASQRILSRSLESPRPVENSHHATLIPFD